MMVTTGMMQTMIMVSLGSCFAAMITPPTSMMGVVRMVLSSIWIIICIWLTSLVFRVISVAVPNSSMSCWEKLWIL